jgi:hypothetical protein
MVMRSFSVMIKKDNDAVRLNTEISTRLEEAGWKTNWHTHQEYVIASTTRRSLLYKSETEVVRHLRELLTKQQLERCTLVKVSDN